MIIEFRTMENVKGEIYPYLLAHRDRNITRITQNENVDVMIITESVDISITT